MTAPTMIERARDIRAQLATQTLTPQKRLRLLLELAQLLQTLADSS